MPAADVPSRRRRAVTESPLPLWERDRACPGLDPGDEGTRRAARETLRSYAKAAKGAAHCSTSVRDSQLTHRACGASPSPCPSPTRQALHMDLAISVGSSCPAAGYVHAAAEVAKIL